MGIIRFIYYVFHSIILNLVHKKSHVSFLARIRPSSSIGENVRIGRKTWFKGSIGDCSYIGENCRLNALIGKFCSISSNVKVVEATHPINFISTSPIFYSTQKQCGISYCTDPCFNEMLYFDKESKIAVSIGNDVWIGENVILKGGIQIGDGAIIAMGAVVTKDVLPYTIVGGVPAKIIKHRFKENTEKELLNLRWWDNDEKWILDNLNAFQINDIDLAIKKLKERRYGNHN